MNFFKKQEAAKTEEPPFKYNIGDVVYLASNGFFRWEVIEARDHTEEENRYRFKGSTYSRYSYYTEGNLIGTKSELIKELLNQVELLPERRL